MPGASKRPKMGLGSFGMTGFRPTAQGKHHFEGSTRVLVFRCMPLNPWKKSAEPGAGHRGRQVLGRKPQQQAESLPHRLCQQQSKSLSHRVTQQQDKSLAHRLYQKQVKSLPHSLPRHQGKSLAHILWGSLSGCGPGFCPAPASAAGGGLPWGCPGDFSDMAAQSRRAPVTGDPSV